MADVNQSVEITLKANIKQLQQSLKSIPGMTKEEASKMVRALSAEMKRATNASKKAALESKKAARSQEQAYKKAAVSAKRSIKDSSVSYQKHINNSKKATQSFSRTSRKNSREIGAAFGSLEDVVGSLDPELAAVAGTLGTVGQAARSLSRSLATGNPIIIGVVVAIAAVAAAYAAWTHSTKQNEESQKKLVEQIKKTNEQIRESKKAFSEAETAILGNAGEVNKLRTEYQLLTGQITAAELAEMEREQAASKFADKAQKDFDAQRRALFEQESANTRAMASTKQRLKDLEDANRLIKLGGGLTEEASNITKRLNNLEKERQRINKQQSDLKEEGQKRTNSQTSEYISLLEKIAIEEKRQADADRAREKAKEAAAEAQRKRDEEERKREQELERLKQITEQIESKSAQQKQANFNQEIANARQQATFIKEEEMQKQMILDLDRRVLENKLNQVEKEKAANLALAETEEQKRLAKELNFELDEKIDLMKEEFHIKEVKQAEERMEQLEKEKKKREELAFAIGGTFSEAAKATSNLIKEVSKEDQQAALIAFRIAQAAAIADIAMTTARKVMEVAPNPIAMGAVGAIGALQGATVLAQSPPEKHMGGFISKGEDTRNVTVLTGEAVLDRRTVERLGGEAGINQLQRSGSTPAPEIVVMNPFKHFDRYARSSFKRGGYLSKMNKTKASGAY